MSKQLLFLFLTSLISTYVNGASLTIKVRSKLPVKFNDQEVPAQGEGLYLFEKETSYPGLVVMEIQDQEWEIYAEVGKVVEVLVEGEKAVFSGDLVPENEHLANEKIVNVGINKFLSKNWYTLHCKGGDQFVKVIDSLQHIFMDLMGQNPELNPSFRKVNKASINYAFKRLKLRYPQMHKRFTGNEVSMPVDINKEFAKGLDEIQFAALDSYKSYVRDWLDMEVAKKSALLENPQTYKGLLKTKKALKIIENVFENQELRDLWSFAFVKSHIEQYGWINGHEFLELLYEHVASAEVKKQIQQYRDLRLAKRKGIETFVFKTVNGFKLEAYIFKPNNFDSTKRYAALAGFHGGGWTVGNASFTQSSAEHAAENGLIGFSAEYRLSNRDDISPEEAMEDVRDFMRWLRAHADSLSVNPDQIIAKGVSAGGHLVSSISVIQEDPQSIPNALILLSPALSTSDNYFKGLLRKGQNAEDLSPLLQIQAGLNMPRVLILQGRTDNLTPTPFAEEFNKKMNELGYESELVIYENCGHLFTPSHLDDTAWPQSDPEVVKRAFVRQAEFYRELGFTRN
ncbi:MAG: alpha/beta hydrolase [Bacteroidia bacterium]|nr:alpha/beta hydrolase [Bacteroidia bacterium]